MRLDGRAPPATFAESAMGEGKTDTPLTARRARTPRPRGERLCMPQARLARDEQARSALRNPVQADQAQPVRRASRGAKPARRGLASASPLEKPPSRPERARTRLPYLNGKRSTQDGNAEMAAGVRDQSRMAATRCEARGNAREPDGTLCRDAVASQNSTNKTHAQLSPFNHFHKRFHILSRRNSRRFFGK